MLRAEARNFVEGKFRTRRNHKIIVIDPGAVFHLDALIVGCTRLAPGGDEVEFLRLALVVQVDLDVEPASPADGDPGIRWDEMNVGS